MPKKNFVSLTDLHKIKDRGILLPEVKEKGVGGRPEGSIEDVKTITSKTREEAKKKFVKRGRKNLDKLFNALLASALGLQYLFKKDKNGFFQKVKDEVEINQFLDSRYGNGKEKEKFEYYYITVEKPNIKALTDLLDRFVGKAINFDQMEEDIDSMKKKEEDKPNPQFEGFKIIEAKIFAEYKMQIKKGAIDKDVIDITKKQG